MDNEDKLKTNKRGKYICPTCGYELIARCDNKIYCLRSGCSWSTAIKRKDDTEVIPEIHNLKKIWQ